MKLRSRKPGRMILIAGLTVLIALAAAAARPQASVAAASITAYRGLGTWVDMYDLSAWNDPVAAVSDMAAHGVRTLYIETANYHNPATASLFQPATLRRFIQECHARKIKVVAWYLPGFKDLDKDYKRSMAAIELRTSDGQKFDSFALDIEDSGVKPASTRSARLKTLSAKIRKAVGINYPLGGIIPSPAGMKINSTYWPNFPYKDVAAVYDVIVPMGYYTYHGDGYAHAYSETRENVRIVREETGRPSIPIHIIAGDASKSSGSETLGYVRALRETGCLGGSMYDWATTIAADWRPLASVRFNKVQRPALPRDVGYAAPLGNCPGDASHPKEVFYQALKQNGQRILHFRLWDVQTDELRLVVNWQDAGALDRGPKGKWSGLRSIAIPASMLKASGRNVIGFVARGEAPNWQRWGVRDVTLVKP